MSLARTVGRSLSVAVVAALALYPMLVYAAIGRFGPSGVAAVLAAVCLARLVVLKLRGRPAFGGTSLVLVCAGGMLLAAVSYWRGSTVAVLYYPALVNAALLVVFAASLLRPPSVIERIARLRDPRVAARCGRLHAPRDAGVDRVLRAQRRRRPLYRAFYAARDVGTL